MTHRDGRRQEDDLDRWYLERLREREALRREGQGPCYHCGWYGEKSSDRLEFHLVNGRCPHALEPKCPPPPSAA